MATTQTEAASGHLSFPSAAPGDVQPANVAAVDTTDDVAPANAGVRVKPAASDEAVAAIRGQVADGEADDEPIAGGEGSLCAFILVACGLSANRLL